MTFLSKKRRREALLHPLTDHFSLVSEPLLRPDVTPGDVELLWRVRRALGVGFIEGFEEYMAYNNICILRLAAPAAGVTTDLDALRRSLIASRC